MQWLEAWQGASTDHVAWCRGSGDGRLSCINLRKGKAVGVSDQLEDELLSLQIMKVPLVVNAHASPPLSEIPDGLL